MVTRLEQIGVPDIEYAGLYFPQIFANLRRINRINAPEITNEDSRELFIQLEKAFSLMGHYNNVLLDIVANDLFIRSAKLPESVKLLLELLNYRLLPASSAEVDILGTLTRTYTTAPLTLLPAYRKVGIKRSASIPEIIFENTSAITTTNRTDQISEAFFVEQSKTGTCYTNSVYPDILFYTAGNTWVTTDLNNYIRIIDSDLGNNTEDLRITELLDETFPGSGIYNQVRVESGGFISETGLTFELSDVSVNHASDYAGALGAAIGSISKVVNDKVYMGHSDVLFDQIDFEFNTPVTGVEGRIEFYDTDENYVNPDSVTDIGGNQLELDISSLLGTDMANDSLVRVLYLPSGAETNVYSIWNGGLNKIRTPTYMGQTTPSTTASDYYVFCNWRPVEMITDGTLAGGLTFGADGDISFTLPQSQDDNWQKYSIYDSDPLVMESREGYMLRYRIVATGATAAIIKEIELHNGDQYLLYTATQGKTVEDNPLGSSDGTANQEFTLTQTPYIYGSLILYVDEGGGDILWTEVANLLSSKSYDRHYVLDLQTDGTGIVKFGDGVNGKIPPAGANNISTTYRIGGDQDGNVGADTVTNNIDASNLFKEITNPRIGRYWVEADWNSQAALERVKQEGPATVSTMYRATSASDCEILARNFRTTANVRPVYRSKAYEESFGPKTIELVVVGPGGTSITTDNKDLLEEYFNGGDTYNGVLVVNHELTVSNYIPKYIGITCEVTAYPIVTEASVTQTLSSLLNPTALELDKTTYTWRFGEEVPMSRVIAEIFNISPGNVFKVEITSPSTDVLLGTRELPMFDISTSSIVIISP